MVAAVIVIITPRPPSPPRCMPRRGRRILHAAAAVAVTAAAPVAVAVVAVDAGALDTPRRWRAACHAAAGRRHRRRKRHRSPSPDLPRALRKPWSPRPPSPARCMPRRGRRILHAALVAVTVTAALAMSPRPPSPARCMPRRRILHAPGAP